MCSLCLVGTRPKAVPVNANISRVKSGAWDSNSGALSPGGDPGLAAGSVLTGSYVWQQPQPEREEHNPAQQSIEDLTDTIAAVIAQSAYDEGSAAVSNLNRQIAETADASPAVRLELQRAGWNSAEFADADLDKLKELRASLREVVAPPAKTGRGTGFTSWFCEALHTWNTPGEDRISSDESDVRDWRLERYSTVRSMALETAQIDKAHPSSKLKLNDTIFHTPTKEVADLVVFHPTEPVLILANKTSGNLFIWNTEGLKETCSWNNRNRRESVISSMKLINEHNVPLLAVGSSDGFVKIWTDFAGSEPRPRLVTGWRAVSKLKETQGLRAGLVLDWNQSLGRMYASGDVEYIQIWDAATESRFQKIPTRISSCVTSTVTSASFLDQVSLLFVELWSKNDWLARAFSSSRPPLTRRAICPLCKCPC